MICGKCKIILVSKISICSCRKDKNENKKRACASLFQSSENGKQENFFMWPSISKVVLVIVLGGWTQCASRNSFCNKIVKNYQSCLGRHAIQLRRYSKNQYIPLINVIVIYCKEIK